MTPGFLPPIDTKGLTPIEQETLRVAHTLHAADAAEALGIVLHTYTHRMNTIRTKYRDQQVRLALARPTAGSPSVGGIMNAGFGRRGSRNW